MTATRSLRTLEAFSVLLFLVQSLRVIFSVLFGIIYDGVFEGPIGPWMVISNLLVLVAVLAPAWSWRFARRGRISIWAVIAALARVGLSVNDPMIRYWAALISLLAGGIYLAGLLRVAPSVAAPAMILALCVDQVMRAAGDTYDLGLRTGWLPYQVLWTLAIFGISLLMRGRRPGEAREPFLGVGGGIAIGAFLFLETSLLSFPNAVARWSEGPYAVIAPLLLGITLVYLVPGLRSFFPWGGFGSRVLLLVLLLLGLAAGYFWEGVPAIAGLLLAHFASLWMMLILFEGEVPRGRSRGGPIAAGMLLLLILNFFNAFAFTYPYTLPFMRGLGWCVYLGAGFLLGLGIFGRKMSRRERPGISGVTILFMLAAISITLISVWPAKESPPSNRDTLRVATYNIHYGYDDPWHFTLESIAKTIEENECDVVAMQEVDTGRMTSYMVDDAYYLSRRLGMQVAYLPTVEHLTGIALLYRGPGSQVRSALVTSLQEQTGIVGVTINPGGAPVHAFGTWLGLSNEDTERQIAEALQFIDGESPALFGGDFNADPESAIAERIRAAGFMDPFEVLKIDPAPPTSPAIDPRRRIDFVWLRELDPVGAWVSESLASDHRMVVVEVALPPE